MREDDDRSTIPSLGSTPTQPPENSDLKRRILDSKQKILSNIKGKFTGEETARWLTNLESSPDSATETIVPGRGVDDSLPTMPALMDTLFDHLQRYSFELNKAANDPELKMTCERPTGYQEKVLDYMTKLRFMRGHLSTRSWAFVMHAEETRASGYFMPIDFLIGFMPGPDFPPYLTITKMAGDEYSALWGIDGKQITTADVPRIGRRIITQLVKVINGEAQQTEKFSFASHEESQELIPNRSFERFRAGESEFVR